MWQPPDPPSYAYLLALYLGDGCLSALPRTVRFHISLDGRYGAITDDAVAAVELAQVGTRARVYSVRGSRGVALVSHGRAWLAAFPQHGPGRKHERLIALVPWQERSVASIRGGSCAG